MKLIIDLCTDLEISDSLLDFLNTSLNSYAKELKIHKWIKGHIYIIHGFYIYDFEYRIEYVQFTVTHSISHYDLLDDEGFKLILRIELLFMGDVWNVRDFVWINKETLDKRISDENE